MLPGARVRKAGHAGSASHTEVFWVVGVCPGTGATFRGGPYLLLTTGHLGLPTRPERKGHSAEPARLNQGFEPWEHRDWIYRWLWSDEPTGRLVGVEMTGRPCVWEPVLQTGRSGGHGRLANSQAQPCILEMWLFVGLLIFIIYFLHPSKGFFYQSLLENASQPHTLVLKENKLSILQSEHESVWGLPPGGRLGKSVEQGKILRCVPGSTKPWWVRKEKDSVVN